MPATIPPRSATTAWLAIATVALSLSMTPPARADGQCDGAPPPLVYGLSNDNTLFVRNPTSGQFSRLLRVGGIDGTLIGIDFRPADANPNLLYGVTDSGALYLIKFEDSQAEARLLSTLAPRFAGGVQSLLDFNPVVNALRLIGSNDQNVAVVSGPAGDLSRTVPQTPLRYATDDVSAGIDPNIAGGAYDTNVAGAPRTTFFMVDYDLDTLVTIAGRTAGGSSDTASGVLRTIGPVVDALGNPFPLAPTADFDITTPAAGTNLAYLVQGQRLFCVDVSPFGAGAPLDTPQKVVAAPVEALAIGPGLRSTDLGLGFIDIAVAPRR